jgi:hypothetical protein
MAFRYLAVNIGNSYNLPSNNADLGNGAEGDIRSPPFLPSSLKALEFIIFPLKSTQRLDSASMLKML